LRLRPGVVVPEGTNNFGIVVRKRSDTPAHQAGKGGTIPTVALSEVS
jgi:hypothetical protein